MHFQAEIDNNVEEIENVKIDDIKYYLKQMNSETHSFCTFSLDDINYIQCAGSVERMIIEYRKSTIIRDFKHFVLGIKDETVNNTSIKYSGGIISLNSNEVLNIDDALEVFETYFKSRKIPSKYIKRNITSMF